VLGVTPAVLAILLVFDALGVLSLILGCRIVLPLALGTFHTNDRLHVTLLNYDTGAADRSRRRQHR